MLTWYFSTAKRFWRFLRPRFFYLDWSVGYEIELFYWDTGQQLAAATATFELRT